MLTRDDLEWALRASSFISGGNLSAIRRRLQIQLDVLRYSGTIWVRHYPRSINEACLVAFAIPVETTGIVTNYSVVTMGRDALDFLSHAMLPYTSLEPHKWNDTKAKDKEDVIRKLEVAVKLCDEALARERKENVGGA